MGVLRWFIGLLAAYVVAYQAAIVLPVEEASVPVFGDGVQAVVQVAAALVVLARAVARWSDEGPAWLLLGVGALSWAFGDVFWLLVLNDADTIPVPSPADTGYLLLIPCAFAGLVLLARSRTGAVPRALLLDGATAALAAGALSAALVLEPVRGALGSETAEILTNLAYIIGDVVLVGVVVGAIAVRGWRLDRTWAALAAGFTLFWIADSHYMVALLKDTYVWPNPADMGWSACLVLLAGAAWERRGEPPAAADGTRLVLLPLLFAATGLAILVVSALEGLNALAVALAGLSMLAVFARLVVTMRENGRMLERSRTEARTDALTALGNRRALLDDLEARLGAGEEPFGLLLFDLDGFKNYNDMFGHPAGDALLARLAGKLARVLPDGASAYRMGGDEFCALVPLRDRPAVVLGRLASLALVEEGEGFHIGCSFGAVAVPAETGDAMVALRMADERLYAAKHSGRASAGVQSSAVLLRALAARDPELGAHLGGVADLAEATGRALGLGEEQLEDLRRAAELHDVGKMGIPEAILCKPGPLDDEEWSYMRRHTVIGERIMAAAPALARAARLVRLSHERWDGRGYPDGRAGLEIPLGARIIAVCDAFDAIRADRPYRAARTEEEALAELWRCAGAQFDPDVVAAFARTRRMVLAA